MLMLVTCYLQSNVSCKTDCQVLFSSFYLGNFSPEACFCLSGVEIVVEGVRRPNIDDIYVNTSIAVLLWWVYNTSYSSDNGDFG